jgi:hypothetical protein
MDAVFPTIAYIMHCLNFLQYSAEYAGKETAFHVFTCRVVSVTKITGSSSDDWIY